MEVSDAALRQVLTVVRKHVANLGEALDRAREMYRFQNASTKGFRIFNAAGELLHVWVP